METYACVPNTIKHSKDFVKLFLHVFDVEKLTSMVHNIVARSLSQEKPPKIGRWFMLTAVS